MAASTTSGASLLDVSPLGSRSQSERTITLLKSDELEVIRLVLPAGKRIEEHQVPGEILLQCIEGDIRFRVGIEVLLLKAGSLVHLDGGVAHSLDAVADATVLLTILLRRKS